MQSFTPTLTYRRSKSLIAANILLPCLIGLDIPWFSPIVIGLLFVINGLFVFHRIRLSGADILRLIVLTCFLVSYYLIAVSWGYLNGLVAILSAILIFMGYFTGLMLGAFFSDKGSKELVGVVISLAAGFTIFGFLCTMTAFSNVTGLLVMDRAATHFWTGAVTVNAPLIGAFSSLSLCLLPIVFLGTDGPGQSNVKFRILIALLAAIGLFSNMTMQNRTPYLTLGLSTVLCSALFFIRSSGPPVRRAIHLLLRLSPLIFLVLFLLVFYSDFVTHILFLRFGQEGLETGRTGTWTLMAMDLFNFPFGGKLVEGISDTGYVHNLWLDVAYTSGLIPFFLLVLFHTQHLRAIFRFIMKRSRMFSGQVGVAILAAVVVSFWGEPMLDASLLYFTATVILLGIVQKTEQLSMT